MPEGDRPRADSPLSDGRRRWRRTCSGTWRTGRSGRGGRRWRSGPGGGAAATRWWPGLTAAVAALLIAVAASATGSAVQYGLAASKEERLRIEAQSRAEAETVAKVARQINWAHDQIPAIEAHIQAQRYHQAFDLLQQVEAILPEDPRLAGLRTECSWELTIHHGPARGDGLPQAPRRLRRRVGSGWGSRRSITSVWPSGSTTGSSRSPATRRRKASRTMPS